MTSLRVSFKLTRQSTDDVTKDRHASRCSARDDGDFMQSQFRFESPQGFVVTLCQNYLYLPALTVSFFLFACGGEKLEPATVHHYGLSKPKYTEVSVPTHIEVQPGDTLFAISKRYNIALRDLIEANHLKAPYELAIGQKLKMPHMNSYTVQQGDTLYSISRTFNISQQEIVALNQLKEPYSLSNGQALQLSGERQNKTIHLSSAQSPASKTDAYTRTYAKSDRSEDVDSDPNQRPKKLMRSINPSSKDGLSQSAKSDNRAGAISQQSKSVHEKPIQQASYQPPARSNGKFIWPLKGKVVSLYGPKSEGLHNDGINIAAPKGAPVQSTENGVVAYVGNELKGFGNLLLIKHGDGYISAYGHLDAIQVKRGDQIAKGQVIGTVGTTGAVRNPQLHFELRKGTKAFDPMTMLGG